MEAEVALPLLAGVQLLAVCAYIGLAATLRRAPLVLGAVAVALAHGLTGASPGSSTSDALAMLRAVGYAALAVGMRPSAAALPAVVVPLGASPAATVVAALFALAVAGLAARARRPLLAVSFVCTAGAEAFTAAARTSDAAAAVVLTLRGLGALVLCVALARAVRTSLEGKVAGAILAGALTVAFGSTLLVGSFTSNAVRQDSERRIASVAAGQADGLADATTTALQVARFVAQCGPEQLGQCQRVFDAVSGEPETLTAIVELNGQVQQSSGVSGDRLALADLAASAAVREALRTGAEVATLDTIIGATSRLVALGVAPVFSPPPRRVLRVAVYGIVVGEARLERIASLTGFEATVVLGTTPVASSLPADQVAEVTAQTAAGGDSFRGAGGTRPAVYVQPLHDSRGETIATLALSASSSFILRTQRVVLRTIFGATVALALLVAWLAYALGRRIARPVRLLTASAARVSAGDLSARAGFTARDELGVLARTFDEMAESLTQVERLKSEFLANVSHELRTPLTPIRGYAELLRREPARDAETVTRYADTILDAAAQMSRTVDLLVDVAALDAGRVVPQYRHTTIRDVVDERLDEWRVRLPERVLRRKIAARLPAVLIDEEWTAKALDELIDNALKFSTGPVTVNAALAPRDGYVRLSVNDRGPGMSGEVFAAFAQADASSTRETGGLGLGLSLVRRIAAVCGFAVFIDSSPRGTVASLDLPTAAST